MARQRQHFDKALDDDVNTFFDGPTSNGAYAGIDTGVSTATAAAAPIPQ
jgi:hypothetical protein